MKILDTPAGQNLHIVSAPHVGKKLVYVAGRYRARTESLRQLNISAACHAGMLLAEKGFMPIIPHSMTAALNDVRDNDFWLNGTLELMRRCDYVLFIQGWKQSAGAVQEHEEAERLNIPIVYSVELL